MVLTTFWDLPARLWDVTTGKPLGPPLQADRATQHAAFRPDGKMLALNGEGLRLWDLPAPRSGDAAQVRTRIEALSRTGGIAATTSGGP
jgi:hypothetical protein